MYHEQLSEALAVVGTIDPASLAAAEHLTDAIDMSKYRRVLFIITTGVLGTNATIDFTIKQATTSGGSYDLQVGGNSSPTKAITQLTKAANDNDQVLVEVRAEECTRRWLKGSLTVGTAASLASVVALGAVARQQPVTQLDSVVQTKA